MAYFNTHGLRLHYDVHGSGPSILLITGFGATGQQWHAQIKALAPHYRVITLDNRGVGQSDAPPGPYSTESMAQDCIDLLDHLKISRAHICGHSLGGRIAQMIAILHPLRVNKLILASTALRSYEVTHFVLTTFIEMVRQNIANYHRTRAFLPWFYSPHFFTNNRKIALLCHVFGQRHIFDADALQAQLAAILHHNPGESLRLIQCPTLITSAAEDLLCPRDYSDELLHYIPHAKRMILPRGGHACLHEYPQDFNLCLLNFLSTTP